MTELFLRARQLPSGRDLVDVTPESARWDFSGLLIVEIGPGGSRTIDLGGAEAAVLPLSGAAEVDIDGTSFALTGRPDVWSGPSDFAFAPKGAIVTIDSRDGGTFAVPTALARTRREAAYCSADQVAVEIRGHGRNTRQINNFMSAAQFDGADRLIAVEVITPEGNVSSFPPHKHDEWSDDEVPLEEIYYFKVRGGDHAMSVFGMYSDDGDIDLTEVVRDGDVALCPRGYHGPAVALPGYDLYYLNVMAGPSDGRVWKFCTDPDHAPLLDRFSAHAPDPRLPLHAPEASR